MIKYRNSLESFFLARFFVDVAILAPVPLVRSFIFFLDHEHATGRIRSTHFWKKEKTNKPLNIFIMLHTYSSKCILFLLFNTGFDHTCIVPSVIHEPPVTWYVYFARIINLWQYLLRDKISNKKKIMMIVYLINYRSFQSLRFIIFWSSKVYTDNGHNQLMTYN